MKSIKVRSFFWSVFSRIRTEYGEIPPYSVRMRKNTDQKKLRIGTLFTQWMVSQGFRRTTKCKASSFNICLKLESGNMDSRGQAIYKFEQTLITFYQCEVSSSKENSLSPFRSNHLKNKNFHKTLFKTLFRKIPSISIFLPWLIHKMTNLLKVSEGKSRGPTDPSGKVYHSLLFQYALIDWTIYLQ